MRYEDASNTGAFQGQGPIANDDSDQLAAGAKSTATGNLITGDGTQTGSVGADSAAGGHITAIAGKGGEDSSFSGGKLNVAGEYGKLSVDAQGNYVYEANKGVENVRDRFTYTLADNNGATDTAALIVEIGKTPFAIKADAQQIVPGPDGVVTLPPGVELSDVHVVGRNLVIDMPDGTQLIIIDGAVFVPQLVLGGVEVPATNVAALLVGQEVQPAAGENVPSSGGNFAVPPPPLDPGVPLGDLIPPTELNYVPPEVREVIPEAEDEEPQIFIQPDGQPAAVNAVDEVNEAGLPTRNGGEPEGSGEEAAAGANGDPREATAGTIIIDSPDGVDSVTINGVLVTGAIGQTIAGAFGTLTITGFSGDDILYSYLLNDNTSGDNTHDDFSVTLTDGDGDQATATLVIDIIDDVPTARPDTDALEVGETFETGNVLTDASAGDVGDTDNGRDTVGADNATITAVSSANVPANPDTDPGANFNIAGQYGVLVLNTDGSYTYTRNENSPGGVQDVFNYTITDGDGDTSSTTLTITIPDATPNLPDPDAVLLDDDALPNGNPGGTDDDVDSQGTPGQLNGTGGDGDLDYAFGGGNTLPPGFTVNVVNAGQIQILQGVTVVLTVNLNTETGAYSVVQNNPIDHPAGADENNLSFSIGVQVVDADGDTEGATLTINVDDDTPELNEVISQGDVTLDETNAGSPAGFPISDTSALPVIDFTAAFGADGAAAVNSAVFGLAITGGPGSGLQTAVGDFAITLVQIDGDTIEGHYNGSNVAFIIQMNGDGTVTLTQNVPLEHLVDGDTPADHNDSLDLGGLIAATVTITDGDGDQDSAQVGIGDNLVFLDDGPNAQVDEEATLDTLVLDETRPVGSETDGDSNPAGLMQTTANFADNFVAPVDHGADGPGTVSYALVLDGDDVPSGLFAIDASDTDAGDGDGYGQGDEIVLNQSGNTITGSAGGVDYFTISIDPNTGVVTFTQLDNIWHANTGSDDDTSSLMAELGSLLVQQLVTDSDGDFDTASVDLSQGVFQIEDDGPIANDDVDNIVSGGETAEGNVITGVGTVAGAGNADDVGEDLPGRVSALSSVNEPGNTDQDPSADVFEVDGEFGTLVLNADGSYTYTRFDGGPGNVQDVFTYTLIDADGDTETATLTINIGDAAPVLPDPDQIHLDDDVIPGADGNVPDGPGDDDPDVVGQNVVNGQLNGSGGDAPLSYNFTGTNTLPAGFSIDPASDADTLIIVQDQNGSDVTVMTIQLDQSDGSFTVTQNNPILHPTQNGTGNDNTENNLDFSIGVEVEDNDGDTDPANITINVDDDTPTIDVVKGTVAEPELTTDDAQTIGGASDTAQSSANFGGLFSLNQSAGADGAAAAATLAYALGVQSQGVNSGLESHNADIFLYEIGGVVVGSTAADEGDVDASNTIFDVTVDANGVVTLTQYQQIDHDTADPTPTGPGFADHIVDLADGLVTLTASSSLTDNDGDTVTDSETVNIGANLNFTDDGPNADVSGVAVGTVTLDETRAEGTDTVGGSAPTGDASATIDFSVNFTAGTFGADGPGTTTYALSLTGTNVNSGLYALDNTDLSAGDGDGFGQGGQIVLNQAGNTITGSFNGTNYFTITIDPNTGVVTFTQLNNIWHPTAGSSAAALDESATLNTLAANLIQVVQTLTDFDGDTDTASINIGQGVFIIQDDGPRFGPDIDAVLNIDNDATPSGTGDLDIVIGTDSPNGAVGNNNPDDISVSNFAIQINGEDAQNVVLTLGAENATTASYSFTFEYDTGTGGIAEGTGTLVFNKAAGTYTVELTSGPIEGFSLLSTGAADASDFVEYQVPDGGSGAAEVTVAQLDTDFFVQFSGVAEPGSGTGSNNLTTTTGAGGAFVPVTVADFDNLELFTQEIATIQVSNTAAGVAGNTIQGGEVLDLNLYSTDPMGTLGGEPTQSSTSMFMTLDGIGGSEDMIVVLKLLDTNTGEYTTKAIIVQNADILTDADAASLVGTPYEGLGAALDNNDGLIVIEANDYQEGNPNLVIVGAQIAGSDEGVTGTGINLNGDVGDTGGSSGTQSFATDVSDAPFKITSIGFLTTSTEDQSATIDFDVTIHDADGDTATQHITVNIGDTAQEPLVTKSSSVAQADDSSSSLLVADSHDSQKVAANSNTVTMAAAVAAAGMADSAAAAPAASDDLHQASEPQVANAYTVDKVALASDDNSSSAAAQLDTQEADAAPGNSGGHSRAYEHRSFDSLDASSNHQSNDNGSAHQVANDQGPAAASADASPVAPTVAMVSAEALAAAGIDGAAKQGGSVETLIAEALGHGNAHDAVDALLDAFHGGGNGGGPDIANLASPAAGGVSAWDMASNGGSAGAAEMLMKVGATALHHDMVQPTHNG